MADTQIPKVLRILEQRERSKSWLARKMGISPTYVTAISKGRKPITARFIRDCARALDLPAEVLFDAETLLCGYANRFCRTAKEKRPDA